MNLEKLLAYPIFEFQFWVDLVDQYKDFGPLAPIFLSMLESFLPVLPLVLIVAFNTTAYGYFLGFLYSYIGNLVGSILVFLFFRTVIKGKFINYFYHGKRLAKILHWVVSQPPSFLVLISALPFAPSSFVNISFGLSGYSKRRFIASITIGKFIMINILAAFGKSLLKIAEQPLFILLSIAIIGVGYYLSHHFSKMSGIEDIDK